MKEKQMHLIGMASGFASFLIYRKVGKEIRKIILFGSVARGDFAENSDIDIFIDIDPKFEKEVFEELSLFNQSNFKEQFEHLGVENDISLKIGNLEKWKSKREIISSGIMLYGKYNELPKDAQFSAMFIIDTSSLEYADQMSVWRKLYGYSQKVGTKKYESKGLIEELNGEKIAKGTFIVPMEQRKEIMEFLKKYKVKYTIRETWIG